jgi:NitT/TauT family transport system substrate-binding protein
MRARSGLPLLLLTFVVQASFSTSQAAEIRIAEQFSIGYLQFNIMKRDQLIEKHAQRRGPSQGSSAART